MAPAVVEQAAPSMNGTAPRAKQDALRARVLSALVMAPLTLGAVAAGDWIFAVFVCFVALMLVYEWDRLCEGTGLGAIGRIHYATILVSIGFASVDLFVTSLVAIGAGALIAFLYAQATVRRRRWALIASPYIGVPSIALIWLRDDTMIGRDMVFWMLAAVWATDIGAYAFGRAIGGRKLAPRFSPAKTWAGLFGGMASAVVVSGLVATGLAIPYAPVLMAFALVLAMWAQAGDIAESALKRHFNVKDSGAMIPGHGGFLDRLDGILFAAPATALIVLLSSEWGLKWH